jgi:hypothetical protein
MVVGVRGKKWGKLWITPLLISYVSNCALEVVLGNFDGKTL